MRWGPMISSASARLGAEDVPVWLAWVIGIGGTVLLAAALFRMAPPVRRREVMTQRVLPALGLFLVLAGIAGPSSGQRLVGHSVEEAAHELGNDSRVTAQATVPFALWTAATYLLTTTRPSSPPVCKLEETRPCLRCFALADRGHRST